MKQLREFQTDFLSFWDLSYLGVDIGISVAIAFILAFAWLFRKKIPQLLLWLLKKAFRSERHPLVDETLDAARSPLEVTILAVSVLIAVRIAGLETLEGGFLHLFLRSIIIIIVFWTLVRMVNPMLTHSFGRFSTGQEAVLQEFAEKGLRILFVLLGLSAILEQWNINVVGLLGSLGLVGAAVALGAKEFFSDILGGIILILNRMVDRGDWIRTPDLEGTVEHVGLRSSNIRQFDKALVTVPNSMLVDRALINFTRMTNRRIYWKIGLEYRTTQDQLRAIVKEISEYIHETENFETNPDRVLTFVFVDSFGDSSIDLMVYCFTKTTNWGEWLEVKQDLIYQVKEIVQRNGTGFAFPSTSLYVESLPFGTPEAFPGEPSQASLSPSES